MVGLLLSTTAFAESYTEMTVEGMSCGEGCPPQVRALLNAIDGVEHTVVDYNAKKACVTSHSTLTLQSLQDAVLDSQFDVSTMVEKEKCPASNSSSARSSREVWQDTTGVDALVVSSGDRFEYKEHQAAGKFTVFDFGAPWCGPCHIAAEQLRLEMEEHTDLAVRAISLGADPKASFELAVAKQHLAFAPGIPWFVVYAPNGKKIYEGGELDKALSKIEKAR